MPHARNGGVNAERVPQLERPELVRIAPAHGAIDFHDTVRNSRDAAGRVQQNVPEERPKERAGPAARLGERAQALGQAADLLRILDAGQ